MSETMTSGEIEDVLSSIRRLVSEDLRPAARPVQASLVSEDSARPAGRLILTPALRVVPPAAFETPAEKGTDPVVSEPLVLVSAVQPEAEVAVEMVGAAPEPVVQASSDPWAHDDAAPAEDVQAWPGETAEAPATIVSWPPVEGSEGWPADPLPEPETGTAALPDPSARTEDVVGTIGAALHRDTDWEPEAGDTAPVTRLSWIEVADGIEEEVEPSPPPRFVHRADPEAQSRPHDASDDPALIGTTEDVLDEAVLREIVRAVLREELQGHLGERITRNIRKLVRAEINRSLTLRDYE
jgi:hypothetical protein